MKAGIIGSGKMGIDLFRYLKNCGGISDLTIVGRNNKTIKMRGHSIICSCDYSVLGDCDLLIEAVAEDLSVKQEVFKNVAGYIKDDCIIASNTSSLDLSLVFPDVLGMHRCIGLHFFYPILLTPVVEVGGFQETSKETIDKVNLWVAAMNKSPLYLEPEAHFLITRILASLISCAYEFYLLNEITIEEIDAAVRNLMRFGAFETLDSIGFNLSASIFSNYSTGRNEGKFIALSKKLDELQRLGYYGRGAGSFSDAEKDGVLHRRPENMCGRKEERLLCLLKEQLLMEIGFFVDSDLIGRGQVVEALISAIGLDESFAEDILGETI